MEDRKFKKRELQTVVISEVGKLPPQAVDIEEVVLGAILLEDDAYHKISDILFPEAFYNNQNQMICQAIVNLKNRGEKADVLTVVQELKKMELLEMVGGSYYISNLTSRIVSSANIEFHMRIVLEKYILRDTIRSSTALIKNAYEESVDPFEIIDEYERNLNDLTSKLYISKSTSVSNLYKKMLDFNTILTSNNGELIGLDTGFKDLNFITGGWQKSDFIILAARPGMGKTAMVLSFAKVAAAHNNKPTLFFSLEQSELQLFHRLCAQESEIPLDKFIKTGLDKYDLVLAERDTARLRTAPLYIDDMGGQTIFDIRTKARKAKREKGIELIVIDYLQLINVSKADKIGNREQEVSLISRALKSLAKELDIPIIALSQLSRQLENRPGGAKIPQLSDLRDSGSIEQDADMVMFIYRPEYYGIEVDANNQPTKGLAKLIIAKNRHGSLDDIDLKWKGECVLFRDFHSNFKVDLASLAPLSNNEEF